MNESNEVIVNNFIDSTVKNKVKSNKKIENQNLNIKKWNNNLVHIKSEWYFKLLGISILLQFHANYLKDQESSLGWSIIVITSITSFIALLEFTTIGISVENNTYYIWGRSLLISTLSVITTLLASWVKKKQFIKRIKEIDKRVYEIEKLRGKIASIIDLPLEDRPLYTIFYNKFIQNVLDLQNYSSLMTPTEINFSYYNITKNYPTLIKNVPPWYNISINLNERGTCSVNYLGPNIKFGNDIIKSYENRNYNGNIISRLFNFYYCKSSCCVEADDGNPFTNNPGIIELIKYNIGAQTEDTQIQIDESIQTDEIINLNN
jgi:hypothetical protein